MKGNFVKIIDFENKDNNNFLVVNQFTIQGKNGNRRPDIVVFINGLPIAVLELKNPADEDEDSFEHKNKFKFLHELAKHISVYFNQSDIPLIISDLFMGNIDRLGSEGPRKPHKIPANVSLINCKNVAEGFIRTRLS